MKSLYKHLKTKMFLLYSKLNTFILTIMILGILELGVYYDVLISMMVVLAPIAPEIAPILIVAFVWILYKGIKKMYQESKKKRCIIF